MTKWKIAVETFQISDWMVKTKEYSWREKKG